MNDGYMDKIVVVDLSTGVVTKEDLSDQVKREYLGGMGLATKILYDGMKPGTDALAPGNVLIFATGPLTGTIAPSAGRIDITAKSPLTGGFGSANAGGVFAPQLKYAGYDALVVKGRAPRPVYLWIDDDKVEILDASHLWGLDTWEATDLIKKAAPDSYGDQVQVLAIGQAGENQVRYASITINYHNSASRTGLGAVMGSKNLKAVAVRGSHLVKVSQPARFEELVRQFLLRGAPGQPWWSSREMARRRAGGTGRASMDFHATRHYQSALPPPHWSNLSLDEGRKYIRKRFQACQACNLECQAVAEVKTGKYAGLIIGDIFTWVHMAWGSLCSIDNLPAIYKCREQCDRLGMDLGDAAETIGFAMELYQRGIISREATDGLVLQWGDENVIMELLDRIAHRQGFGDLLAEGSRRAGQQIGNGAEWYSVQVRGTAPYATEKRSGSVIEMLSCLISPTACYVKSTHESHMGRLPRLRPPECQGMSENELWQWFVNQLDMPPELKQKIYGSPPKLNPDDIPPNTLIAYWTQSQSTIKNSVGTCMLEHLEGEPFANMLSACTGMDLPLSEVMRIAERIILLQRAFNAREGITRKDQDWPARFYEEGIADGPMQGRKLSKEKVNLALDEYFGLIGCDKETGIPTRQKLQELNLNYVADELETIGLGR